MTLVEPEACLTEFRLPAKRHPLETWRWDWSQEL